MGIFLPGLKFARGMGRGGGFILWQREGGEARSSRSGVKRSGEYELGAEPSLPKNVTKTGLCIILSRLKCPKTLISVENHILTLDMLAVGVSD